MGYGAFRHGERSRTMAEGRRVQASGNKVMATGAGNSFIPLTVLKGHPLTHDANHGLKDVLSGL
ncbi:MAG: hypothetical protein ACYC1Q_03375 [Bacteroidia bacterium]